MSTQKRTLHTRRPSSSQTRGLMPQLELLEDRTLLAVNFTAAPLTIPANRPDTPLGMGSGTTEPFLAVNPRDPGQVTASSQSQIRVTTNGGGSFTGATGFPAASSGDTGMIYDNAGRLFWTNLAGGLAGINIVQINPTTGAVVPGTFFSVSTAGAGNQDDKQFLAVDLFNNNLYMTWTRFLSGGGTRVLVSRSTNQGQTWSAPLQVDNGSDGFVWPASIAVSRATGFVYVAYHSTTSFTNNNPSNNSGRIVMVRFTNTLTSPVRTIPLGTSDADITYNVQTAGSSRVIPGMRFWTQGAGQAWILPDEARSGNVYVIAADAGNFTNDPMDVRIVRSTTNGTSWGAPAFVDVGPGISAQMFPNAAIDRFGNIVVTWYDNRRGIRNGNGRCDAANPTGNFCLDVFARYSIDGGVNFSSAFQVNDLTNAFNPDPGAAVRFSGPPPTIRIGEYYGVGLFGGTAYVAWTGSTFSGITPVGQQVWFQAFAIRGSLTVTGTAGADTITLRTTSGNSNFVEVIVNGLREYAGLWSALTGITINAGTGNDIINIENVVSGTPVTANAGSDNDTVNIAPTTRNLDNIDAPVTVNADAGLNALNINDQNNGLADTWTLTNGSVSRTGGGSQTITYSGFNNGVTINGGTGSTTFNVLGTTFFAGGTTLNSGTGVNTVNIRSTSGPLTVNGQNGFDTVNIGSTTNTLVGIGGVVTVSNTSSFSTININDQGTSAARTVTMTNTGLTGLAPVALNWIQGDVRAITVNAGSGGNTFNVTSTPTNGSFLGTTLNTGTGGDSVNVRATTGALVVNGGNGNDSITVGSGGAGSTINAILGAVTVNGLANTDSLFVDDRGNATSQTYTITATTVARTGGPATLTYGTIESLTLFTGSSTINVPATAAGVTTTVQGGPNVDTFNVGTGNLDTIQGPLTLVGNAGADSVNLNDASQAVNRTMGVTASSVTRSGAAAITFGSVESLALNAGGGSDTINILATATATPVTVNAGAGNDTINVGSAANLLSSIQGNLTVNGNVGTDTVNLNDQGGAGSLDYFISAAAVTGSGFPATINYSALESLVVRAATAGNNGEWITGTAVGTPVRVFGSGSDFLIRTTGATTWNVTGADAGTMSGAGMGAGLIFSGCFVLTGSPDDDTFIIADGQGVSGYIDGTTGINTLDYSGWTSSGVYVDLFSNIAFQGAPNVFGIAYVFGGAGDDYLHGDFQDNWLVGNAGHDIILGDEGADYLQGGAGADQLYGGGGADWLEGGTGEDLLIDGYTSYDYDVTALSEIWLEWTRLDGTDYYTRIDNLRNGTGFSTYLLDSNNVFSDADADVLLGEDDLDWFWGTDGFDFLDRIDPDEILN